MIWLTCRQTDSYTILILSSRYIRVPVVACPRRVVFSVFSSRTIGFYRASDIPGRPGRNLPLLWWPPSRNLSAPHGIVPDEIFLNTQRARVFEINILFWYCGGVTSMCPYFFIYAYRYVSSNTRIILIIHVQFSL